MKRGLQYLVAGAMALGLNGNVTADDAPSPIVPKTAAEAAQIYSKENNLRRTQELKKNWGQYEHQQFITDLVKYMQEHHSEFGYSVTGTDSQSRIAIERTGDKSYDGFITITDKSATLIVGPNSKNEPDVGPMVTRTLESALEKGLTISKVFATKKSFEDNTRVANEVYQTHGISFKPYSATKVNQN